MFAFLVLGLVSSVLCQEFGSKERLRNDRFVSKSKVNWGRRHGNGGSRDTSANSSLGK